jgi:hypothetical protein
MKNRTQRKKGGACNFSSGAYAESIYGASDAQQTAPNSGNLIAVHAPPQSGGKKMRKGKGGSSFVDLGVPLVLGLGSAALTCRRCRKGKKGGKSSKRKSEKKR